MLKNKRQWLREWLEFYLMMGAEHFIIYDNGSTDLPLEVLQSYIDQGLVTYLPWPPSRIPSSPRHFDTALDQWQYSWFKDALGACLSNDRISHRQVFCQLAAFSDAIRRTKGGVSRWLANLDVNNYMFPRPTSEFKSLAEILLCNHADTDHIRVPGKIFGTNRQIHDVAGLNRGDSLHALMTESYILRAPDDRTFVL